MRPFDFTCHLWNKLEMLHALLYLLYLFPIFQNELEQDVGDEDQTTNNLFSEAKNRTCFIVRNNVTFAVTAKPDTIKGKEEKLVSDFILKIIGTLVNEKKQQVPGYWVHSCRGLSNEGKLETRYVVWILNITL